MTDALRPDTIAKLDQIDAMLTDLVGLAREHLPRCKVADVQACPGIPVTASLYTFDASILRALLMLSLVRLARQPEAVTDASTVDSQPV